MREGKPAIGTTEPCIPHASISSFEGVVPKTTDWRTLGSGSEKASTQAQPETV
jgi:phthalate 4,5-dioxygenase